MRTNYLIAWLIILFNSLLIESEAQPGALDTSFGINGIVTTKIGPEFDGISSIVIQPDQKIIAGGFTFNGNNFDFALARYGANGVLDESFGVYGIVTTEFGLGDDVGTSAFLQSDGKIVISGYTENGSINDFAIVRYNPNGSIDSSFGTNGKVITTFDSFCVLSASALDVNEKFITVGCVGNGSVSPGFHVFAVCRYFNNGMLDPSFGDGGKVLTALGNDAFAQTVAIQQDGKIVVGGPTYFGFNTVFSIVRYMDNGALDSTFGDEGKVFTSIGYANSLSSLAIQEDGKIIVVGDSFDFYKDSFATVRYNSDGTLDQTFGSNGIVLTSFGTEDYIATTVCLQPENKILVAGNAKDKNMNSKMALVRYHSNGSLDSTFGTNGLVLTSINDHKDLVRSMAIQADNKIVIGGWTSLNTSPPPFISAFVVARYLPDGNPGIIEPKHVKTPFHINPNPVISELHCEVDNSNNGNLILEAYSIHGKMMLKQEVLTKETISIDVSDWQEGLYVFRLSHQNSVVGSVKVLVRRF